MPGRVETEVSEKGRSISRDLRVNQMIRIPQVRVVDEEGAQLGIMPTARALEMAQERGLDLVEVAPMAQPPVARFLDFGQYKYELTKKEKENKRRQRSVTFKEVRLSPKIGVGRLRDEGPSGDRVPGGRRPDQGHRPLPGTRADPSGARAQPDRQVRGPSRRTRGRGTSAVARGQVDAHHDGIDPQAEEPRGRPRRTCRSTSGRRVQRCGGSGRGGSGRGGSGREGSGRQSRGTRRGRRSGRATGDGREERTAGPEAGSNGSRTGGRNRRVSPACRR